MRTNVFTAYLLGRSFPSSRHPDVPVLILGWLSGL